MLRQTRWLAAGVLAVVAALAAPTRSVAGTTILIEEINAVTGEAIIGTTQTFSGGLALYSTPNFTNIGVNAAVGTAPPSIATGFSFLNTNTLTAGTEIGVRIQITDTFTRPTTLDTYTITSRIQPPNVGGGTLSVDNETVILNPDGTLYNPNAPGVGPTYPVAQAVSPTNTTTEQTLALNSLPDTYQIQQTITLRLLATSTIDALQTYSGAVRSQTLATTPSTPGSVPAPGGLLLAAAAIPALGLRRVLRKRAAA